MTAAGPQPSTIAAIERGLGAIIEDRPFQRLTSITPGRSYRSDVTDWGLSGEGVYDFGWAELKRWLAAAYPHQLGPWFGRARLPDRFTPGDQLRIEVTVLNWRSRAVKMGGNITVDGKLVCDATVMCQVVPRLIKKAEAGPETAE